jgi:hypothetical protein
MLEVVMESFHLGLVGIERTKHPQLVAQLEDAGCRVDCLPESKQDSLARLNELQPDAALYLYNENTLGNAKDMLNGEQSHNLVPWVLMVEDETSVSKLPSQPLNAHGVLFYPFQPPQIFAMVELAIHLHRQERVKDVMLSHYVESLRNVNEAVILSDTAGRVLFVNEKAMTLTGFKDAGKRRVDQVFLIEGNKNSGSMHPVLHTIQKSIDGHSSYRTNLATQSQDVLPIQYQVKRIERAGVVMGACVLFHEIKARATDQLSISLNETSRSEAAQLVVDKVKQARPDEDHEVRIQVRTFGEFSLIVDSTRIETNKWRSKKALDVFSYLLLHYGQPVHKEVLIDFLWPNLDTHTGNRRLLNAVSELRKYLEPDAKRYARNSFVRHESGVYRLDFGENVYIDTLVFRELVRNGDYQWATGMQRMARTFYLEALQHKDGQFLPRYLYEREFEETREQYEITEDRLRERIEQS